MCCCYSMPWWPSSTRGEFPSSLQRAGPRRAALTTYTYLSHKSYHFGITWPRTSTPWSMGIILAATDTRSSSCTRMTMPRCLLPCLVRVVCAHVCDAAAPLEGAQPDRGGGRSRVSCGARSSSLVQKGCPTVPYSRGISRLFCIYHARDTL